MTVVAKNFSDSEYSEEASEGKLNIFLCLSLCLNILFMS